MSALDGIIRAHSNGNHLDQRHFSQVCDDRFLFIGELRSGERTESVRAAAPQAPR
jgi:hypothetical protein